MKRPFRASGLEAMVPMLALQAKTAWGLSRMATITVRGLDDETRARLRVRAAQHGRSTEAEVRAILQELTSVPAPVNRLGSRIHARFAALGGVDLDLPPRNEMPSAPFRG